MLALVLIDLFGFELGLNPAIARADDRPVGALIAYLSRVAPPPARILGVGAELPPNCLMRYGLADVHNYDAIEAARNLDDFAPLYEPSPARTSRRDVTWSGVACARDRLCAAGVAAVVGPTPPPVGLFPRVDRVGRVWVGRWPRTGAGIPMTDHGHLNVRIPAGHRRLAVAEMFDLGWRAEVDGRPVRVEPVPVASQRCPWPPARAGWCCATTRPRSGRRRRSRCWWRCWPARLGRGAGLQLPEKPPPGLGRVRCGELQSDL